MISFLEGQIVHKFPTKIIMDVNGVGYEVSISLNTYERLPQDGEKIRILTYLHVREDMMQLFGFALADERDLFLKLIAVSGVGPRLAQGILSGTTPQDFKEAVLTNNLARLTAIPGVGRKTAQRLVLDLKEKFQTDKLKHMAVEQNGRQSLLDEAVLALVSLGYRQTQAQRSVQQVLQQFPDLNTLEELIKHSLTQIQKNS
ncbi:Holliday junction ATP-dependent DNA helicase RuvA [bacterium BMS3Abin05]|nr:Holliday junction ATP-dependent DNA helicase RuvA [bacterium BMS3Abin05]GBE26674.1 Holliday junction ATP-dependent DNA helicase RuvA [bacterium BMS3Bbin03]HDK36372.1 Holliday junction branch migration protein RuvA [Bacteroidota bacterium]